MFSSFDSPDSGFLITIGIVIMIFAYPLYFIMTILIFAFIALQYFSLVEKNDAPTLHDRIEQIGQQEQETPKDYQPE